MATDWLDSDKGVQKRDDNSPRSVGDYINKYIASGFVVLAVCS